MASSSPISDENLSMMTAMGFERDQSLQALEIHGGDVQRAIDFLLNGGDVGAARGGGANGISGGVNSAMNSEDTSSNDIKAIHSDVSQYTEASGRSACTAIALTMAHHFLTQIGNTENASETAESIVTSSFLSETIREGIQIYTQLHRSSGVDHSSVEELLNSCPSDVKIHSLRVVGGSPQQGILSHSSDNPMGMETWLSQCANGRNYVAVVITKPPETVLVLLPPSSGPYILLDSHPRPNQLAPHSPTGSYALLHSSLGSLMKSLKQIFPVTDLGSDVPEMMAMMYNSFDLYPLHIAQ